jgi:predicted DNA-binding transcriptional regulator AlpA
MEKQLNKEEEYLDMNELCNRIKYKKQTIYNKIYKKEFIIGKHYKKPSKKKLLFILPEIENWLDEQHKQTMDTEKSSCLGQNGKISKNSKRKLNVKDLSQKNLIKI